MKIKLDLKLLFTGLCFLVSVSLIAQNCNYWTGPIGDETVDVFIDDDGNSYVYENNFDFYGYHYFAKYDESGNIVFLKELNISGGYFLADVVGNDESVYIITSFAEYTNEDEVTSSPSSVSGLVLKYDLEGNLLWEKIFEVTEIGGYARTTSGIVDQEGNLYVGMWARGNVEVDGVEYVNDDNRTSFFKYNAEGGLVWVKESQGYGRVNDMELTTAGNIAACFLGYDDIAIGGIAARAGGLVTKFSPDGNFYYMFSTSQYVIEGETQTIYDVGTVGENVYFTGSITSSFSYSEGTYDTGTEGAIIGMLDSKGNLIWASFLSSSSDEDGWGAVNTSSDDVVQILVPVATDSFSELLTVMTPTQTEEVAIRNDGEVFIADFDATTGDFIGVNGISIISDPIEISRGASFNGNKVFIPFNATTYFDPESDEIEDKEVFMLVVDLAEYSFETDNRILISQDPDLESTLPAGTSLTLEAAGDMTSGQWYQGNLEIDGATSNTLSVTESGTYYYQGFFDSGCSGLSTQLTVSFFEETLENDSLTLVDFYNDMTFDGIQEWDNDDGWLSLPLDEWFGVTVENGRVTGLNLEANSLGQNSFSLVQLTALEQLDLSDNNLNDLESSSLSELNSQLVSVDISNNNFDYLPDLSILPSIQTLDVRGVEELSFEDLELNTSINNLLYDDFELTVEYGCLFLEEGESVIFSEQVSGINNIYNWTKDDVNVGNTTNELEIISFSAPSAGTYELTVTNSEVAGSSIHFIYSIAPTPEMMSIPDVASVEASATSEYDGDIYNTNNLVTIQYIGNDQYSISDISGGFYQSFDSGDQEYAIGSTCDGGFEVLYGINSFFEIISDGEITWDEPTGTLTIPWRDDDNLVEGVTTVSFLKETQTISFSLDEEIEVGSEINLNAIADSGLPVSYEIMEGEDLVTLSNGVLTATGTGFISVQAYQEGDDDFYAALSVDISSTIIRAIPDFDFVEDQDETYTGEPHQFTVTTNPEDLEHFITYSGSNEAIDVGVYEVEIAALSDSYIGYSSGTLTIDKAQASISVSNTTQDYDGEVKKPTVSTVPDGLNYLITYNDGATAPIDAGEYDLFIEIDETNYEGEYEGSFTILEALGLVETKGIVIYPNPVLEDMIFTSKDISFVRILDLSGKVLNTSFLNINILDLSDLQFGAYLLEAFDSSGRLIYKGKFVKK